MSQWQPIETYPIPFPRGVSDMNFDMQKPDPIERVAKVLFARAYRGELDWEDAFSYVTDGFRASAAAAIAEYEAARQEAQGAACALDRHGQAPHPMRGAEGPDPVGGSISQA